MAWREPSEVLGLPRGAPRHEVKAAFRRLALLYHPDVDSSPAAAAAPSSGGGGEGVLPSIQTSYNTVDVRGRTASEAEDEVAATVASSRPGWLFVVHGVGTGRVRNAVLGMLRRHPRVQRVEEQEGSQGGCSMALLR